MLTGLTFTFITGLIWVAVGIVFSISARRKLDFAMFMFCCSVFGSLASLIFIPNYGRSEEHTSELQSR